MKCLNVGTVPTFKMHNVGTVPTFKMHNVVTVPSTISIIYIYHLYIYQIEVVDQLEETYNGNMS